MEVCPILSTVFYIGNRVDLLYANKKVFCFRSVCGINDKAIHDRLVF